MATAFVPRPPADGRVKVLDSGGGGGHGGEHVLLWVSCAIRTAENPALEHALAQANRLGERPMMLP